MALPLNRAAKIFRKRKDWAKEAKVLDLSVYIDPHDPKVHSLLRESAVEGVNRSAPIAAFQVILGLNPPDRAGAYYNLAQAYLGARKKTVAKRETLRAAKSRLLTTRRNSSC